jgi:FAD/FMN-containing dehydrogenase
MLLASLIWGLTGTSGRQVRYVNPQTLGKALKITLSVQEAEKQERFNESFYTEFEESLRLSSRSQAQDALEKGVSVTQLMGVRSITHAIGKARPQALTLQQRVAVLETRWRRPHRAAMSVMAWECPTRFKRETKPLDPSRKRDYSRRSRRVSSPRDENPSTNKQETRREATSSVNGERA